MKTILAALSVAMLAASPAANAGSSCWNGKCWNHHSSGINPWAAAGLGAFALGATAAGAYPWRAPVLPPFYTWLPGPYPYVTPHACWNFYTSWYFPC